MNEPATDAPAGAPPATWLAQPTPDPESAAPASNPEATAPGPELDYEENARQALEEVRQWESAGDLRRAFVTCQAVLIDNYGHLSNELLAELHLTLGRISIAQDKPERARKYLDKAAALDSKLEGPAELRHAEREAPNPEERPPSEETPPPVPSASERPDGQEVESGPASGRLAWAASFWARALAMAMDVALVLGLMVIMSALAAGLLGLDSQAVIETVAGGFSHLAVVGLLFVALLLIYLTVFGRFGGQTLGKMLLGLRVVQLDGHSLTTWQALRRTLGMILAGLPGLAGFVWAAFDLDRRGWHDRIGSTLVVRLRPPRSVVQPVEPAPAGARGT